MMLSIAKPGQYGEDIAVIRRRHVKRKINLVRYIVGGDIVTW